MKKLICVFLAVLMMFTLCTTAFAAVPEHPFDYYTSLGDSIGWHVQYNRNYIFNSAGFLESTYPSLVLEHYGLTEGFYGNRCGWRATEALIALDEDYYGDDYSRNFLPYWGGTSIEGIKALSPAYIEGIKNADLITLNFGSNELLGTKTYVVQKVMTDKTAGTEFEKATLAAIEKARQMDDLNDALESMLAFIEDKLTSLIQTETLVKDLTAAVADFPQVWAKLIAQIRELNPDATIAAVSIYNPSGVGSVTDLVQQSLIDLLNTDMKTYAAKSGEYIFVDVGTPNLTGSRDGSHLGDVGHREVADKIIKAVNATLPCDHANTTLVNVKAATRLTLGYTGDVVCSDCGKLLERGIVVTYHNTDVREIVSAANDLFTGLLKLHNMFAK